MKVSLNLAQHYSNVDLKKIKRDELLNRIGAQLGAIEEVIDWAPKYEGVIVVKIVSCEDHPNADRLHVCVVDDGGKAKGVKRDEKGLVQVVCGAPNVKAGMFVAWLPPGSTVPASRDEDEPFLLEARELRGVVSNGMLASSRELGISDDHAGILEIVPSQVGRTPKPGDPFVECFDMDDLVIDCENKMFTHRPDCFGNLGVARELAGISGLTFKSPDWYLMEPEFKSASSVKLNIRNDIKKLVPRFMAVVMENVHVHPSPVWLQATLTRVGLKPVNNVVDVTNYVMHLTGQPLHAFDYDKLNSSQLGPRMANKGEKIALLNGKTIELTEDNMVIATDKQAVALAGVMGGSETEVDEHTTRIVIEAATFDMYTVRRTSMRHGLFTDASTRFTKGQSPLQNDRAIAFAMDKLVEVANAKQASAVHDVHGKLGQPDDVVVTAQFVNERLGTNLSLKEITQLLERTELGVVNVPADKNRIHVRPPFWRTDLSIPEDIVEEVGRLHGFDTLPQKLPPRSMKPTGKNEMQAFKMHLRYKLKEAGANEVLTYSFVHGDLLRTVGVDPDEKAYHLRNAISPGLQYYRTSLLPSLLDKVQANIRANRAGEDNNEFAIYEIGKAHIKGELDDEKLPFEFERLALVWSADDKSYSASYEGSVYYQAKLYLDLITNNQATYEPLEDFSHPLSASFQKGRSAEVKLNGFIIGVIGEFNSKVRKSLKLPPATAGFEVYLPGLLEETKPISYEAISSFPKAEQDVTYEVESKTMYAVLKKEIDSFLEEQFEEKDYQYWLVPRDIFKPEDSDKLRFTFRIWLAHPSRTLTTEETNTLLTQLSEKVAESCDAVRI